jgi:hypothetical protein
MEDDGSFLLACFLSMFTFVSYFFGWKISLWYFLLGLVFMIAAIYYWIKVKKDE